MPLPIAHALVGASLAAAAHTRPDSLRYRVAIISGAFLANAPDLDFFLVFALHNRAWHRGFTHSLAFAGIVCLLFILTFGARHMRDALAYGLAYTSHCILDFMTTKAGGGVELFWPFSAERLGLRWVGLSELPSHLPPFDVLKWLAVEFLIFAPLLLAVLFWRHMVARRAEESPARGEQR